MDFFTIIILFQRKEILGLWLNETESKNKWMQIFDYGTAVRKTIYTTNAIGGINSNFRKETKKGASPNEISSFKLLYLRVLELEEKRSGGHIRDWSMVMNQLPINPKFENRIQKYIT